MAELTSALLRHVPTIFALDGALGMKHATGQDRIPHPFSPNVLDALCGAAALSVDSTIVFGRCPTQPQPD
jgi:hypothetical protein